MTDPPSSLGLLRSIYRHLDRRALLRDHPELDEDALLAFFERLTEMLPPPSPDPPLSSPLVETDPVVLYSDGGSRGNPGPAGFGFVLQDRAGETIAEGRGFLGRVTNNVAEYEGLLAGLRKVEELAASDVEVRSDSELLVRQMNGVYRVKSSRLRPLHAQVKEIASRLKSCRFVHVAREQNRRADELANEAMDRRS